MTKAMVRFDSEFDYLELRLHTIPDGVVMVNLHKTHNAGCIFASENTHLPWVCTNTGITAGFTIVMELGE